MLTKVNNMAADEEIAFFLNWNVLIVGLWENWAHWVYPINRNTDIFRVN